MKQGTGSKLRKEYIKAIYCHPTYVTSMQSTLCKMQGLDESQAGIKNAKRNINNLRYADDITLMAENKEELMSLFGEGNGTPLQYSCLENPMDGGAWWAAVHGIAKSQTRLKTSLSLLTFMHWRR